VSDDLVLTLRAPLAAAVDFSGLALHAWTELGAADVARLTVRVAGSGAVALGDLFDVRGGKGGRARFAGDLSRVEALGAGLERGEVVVEGNVGREVGARMRGGRIAVTGNAGWGAGLELAGGLLEIDGDAGPRAGGASLGAKRGMTGGEVIVRGSTGPEAGACMRRGLVAVAGDVGEGAGRATLAGTLVVFGTTGPIPGQWSKRGSILALGPVTPPATYRYACSYRPEYAGLILRHLGERRGLPVTHEHLTGSYRRYSGDLAELGAGEILAWTQD
jgi:formylmethanofuran dehydrogenase subunit C